MLVWNGKYFKQPYLGVFLYLIITNVGCRIQEQFALICCIKFYAMHIVLEWCLVPKHTALVFAHL